VIILKFWEDDEEIRIGGRAGMVPQDNNSSGLSSVQQWSVYNISSFYLVLIQSF